MQECVYIVQDTCPWHQRLDAVHQWHMGKHIRKRPNCWSVEKVVVCVHEGKRTSLWTSAKLKPALFRANTLHNRLFSEPPTVYQGKRIVLRPFHCSYLKANIVSKSEGIRKVDYAYHFRKCADAVYQKLSKVVYACWNYSLPKLAHFLRDGVEVVTADSVAAFRSSPGCPMGRCSGLKWKICSNINQTIAVVNRAQPSSHRKCCLRSAIVGTRDACLENLGNVREFDTCLGNVRDFAKSQRNVREKVLSGKSCLKLFIVICIFASVQVFSTSMGMTWVTINMPSAAEECRELSGNCQDILYCLASGHPAEPVVHCRNSLQML